MCAGVARRDQRVGIDEQTGNTVGIGIRNADDDDAGPQVVLQDPIGEHI